MYIASYQGIDGRSLYQVLVHFPKLILEGGEPAWTVAYRAFVENLLDADIDFAYRVGFYGGEISRYVILNASSRDRVQDLVNTVDRMNQIVEESAIQPRHQAEHDRMAARFPSVRRTVCRQKYFAAGVAIPCDFFVYPLVPRLLRLALTSRNDFALQLNCRRHSISHEELRNVRKRLADLKLCGRAPAQLIAHISQRVDDLPNHAYLVEESIGVASTAALNSTGAVIETTFRRNHSALGFSGSPLGEPPSEEEIVMGLHSSYFENATAPQDIWRTRQPTDLGNSLGWIPDQTFASLSNASSGLNPSDLLAQISRRLDDLERKAAMHPDSDTAASLRGALGQTDLHSAAGTARRIVETIVRKVLAEVSPADAKKITIFDKMIDRVQQLGAVPGPVCSSMHTVRIVGNIGAHGTMDLTRGDMEACMIGALRVVEWFLLERTSASKAS
jgi:hypothetical protein